MPKPYVDLTAAEHLENAVKEAGWNLDSQLQIMTDFVDELVKMGIMPMDQFTLYLFDRVEDEINGNDPASPPTA